MEDIDPYLRSIDAGRELEDENALSRYSQTWTVVQEKDGADPIIRTTMEMEWINFEYSAFKSIGKGSVDDYEVTSVTGLENSGSASPFGLSHEVWEKDGYVFVKWYMNFDSGEDSNSSQSTITFTIEYLIRNKIEKGCTKAYCSEYSCTDTTDVGEDEPDSSTLMQDYCVQWFHPEWANQFKIPVENVSYSFTLPQQRSEYIASSLRFKEFTSDNPYRDKCSISTPATANKTSIFVDCAKLNPYSEISPQRPTFQWYVNDTEGVVVSTCNKSCGGGGGGDSSFLVIGAGVGAAVLLMFVGCYCFYRKRQKNSAPSDFNAHVGSGRNGNQHNEVPVSADVVWDSDGGKNKHARNWNKTPVTVATPILFAK